MFKFLPNAIFIQFTYRLFALNKMSNLDHQWGKIIRKILESLLASIRRRFIDIETIVFNVNFYKIYISSHCLLLIVDNFWLNDNQHTFTEQNNFHVNAGVLLHTHKKQRRCRIKTQYFKIQIHISCVDQIYLMIWRDSIFSGCFTDKTIVNSPMINLLFSKNSFLIIDTATGRQSRQVERNNLGRWENLWRNKMTFSPFIPI